MADLNSLRNEKIRYQELYATVSQIASKLALVIDPLQMTSVCVNNAYNVNGSGYDEKKISLLKTQVQSKADELKNKVLPDINAKIAQINTNITELEEYERQRALEQQREYERQQEYARQQKIESEVAITQNVVKQQSKQVTIEKTGNKSVSVSKAKNITRQFK